MKKEIKFVIVGDVVQISKKDFLRLLRMWKKQGAVLTGEVK